MCLVCTVQKYPTREALKGSLRSHIATVPPEVYEGLRLKGARRKKVSRVKRGVLQDRALKLLGDAKVAEARFEDARRHLEKCQYEEVEP